MDSHPSGITNNKAPDNIEPQLSLSQGCDDTRIDNPTAALVHVPMLPAGFATDVVNLQTEYRELNTCIEDLTTELLAEHRTLMNRLDTDLIPMLGQMQKVLSKRGELHLLLTTGEIATPELADLDELPTWTDWYETFRERVNLSLSLRTVQRKLAKLRGKPDDGTPADPDDSMEDDPIDETDDKQDEREEIKTGQELLSEFATTTLEGLTGKSVMSYAMRVEWAAERVRDLQQAIVEGKLLDLAHSVGNPEPAQQQGNLMADTDECTETLESSAGMQYAEPSNAKTDYEITVTITGKNIKTVTKQIEAMFPGNDSVQVSKVENATSRADRLAGASDLLRDAANEIGGLREELEEWRDNLPENLQSGSKSEELEEVISALQEIDDSIQGVVDTCDNVEFPGMF